MRDFTGDRRRADLERIATLGPKIVIATGLVIVRGVGEAIVDIDFPAPYFERPCITFGAELGENHSPEAGNFPRLDATVLSWVFQDISPIQRYFAGARLGVTTSGKAGQEMWVHWVAMGKALTAPIGTSTEV